MSSFPALRRRRSLVTTFLFLLASALAVLSDSGAAHAADDRTPFVVIGTSDVSDSNLVNAVLKPRFEAQYPQYRLDYVAKGTGAAITDARNGLGAALIVHAAAIENQFVGDGFSLEEYGRLVFWGDYVLLGPNDDPADIATQAPNDIIKAFELVAAAGAAGQADFISRGGTPGTAVQERALWALTTGVPTCTVGNPSGGGTRPKDPASASGTCTSPDDVTYNPPSDPTGAPFPTWYHTGVAGSQAGNVNLANTCSTATNPSGKCYVFTDRGTYKYLRSTNLAQNLKIVTRDNAPAARGGTDAMVNVFHAYGVNPAKFADPSTTKTNATAAKLFLDFIQAPNTQAAIGAHLAGDGDQAFVPAAAPELTASITSNQIDLSGKTTVSGHLENVVPGYPALNGVKVNLLEDTPPSGGIEIPSIPKVIGSTTSDANGNFSVSAKLTGGKRLLVGVGDISKIEITILTPQFGSLLASTDAIVGVTPDLTFPITQSLGKGKVKAVVATPAVTSAKGKVVLYAAKAGGKHKKVGLVKLTTGKSKATFKPKLGAGKWKIQAVFKDGRVTKPLLSKITTVTVF